MSKKAIAKLNKEFPNYSLNVEVAGSPDNKGGLNYTVKAFVQIFDPKYEAGKQPTIIKSVNSYGLGPSVGEAQSAAIEAAVENLGL